MRKCCIYVRNKLEFKENQKLLTACSSYVRIELINIIDKG